VVRPDCAAASSQDCLRHTKGTHHGNKWRNDHRDAATTYKHEETTMMHWKKLLLAAAALGLAAGAQAQTKLKWAHVYETSEPFHKWSVWAANEFGKRTNGKYQIDVYPASQLGKESDINQGLTLGTVDIIISGSSFASRAYQPIGVTYYPYTFRDADHLVKYTKSDVYKSLTGAYAEKTGNQIVATTYYGTRHTTSNKPINSCADMKGLKIRVPDVAAYLAMPRACGANTAPIAFAEVYLALQNGTVEAQENPLTTIEAKKFYEVQKYIVLTGHIVDHLNTVVSGKQWKQFNDSERKLFSELAQEAAQKAGADIVARETELVEVFKKKGLNVSGVDRNDFRNTVLKNVKFEDFGYRKADWDRIQEIK
jgi:tripartite ATP-independent transporter DctP family solute receptor